MDNATGELRMLVCLFFNKKFEEADTNLKLKSSREK